MAETAVVRSGPDGENDEIARLEVEIALGRERVAASLGELRRRIHVATSWRHSAQAHPIAWISVAVCVGFIIGYRAR